MNILIYDNNQNDLLKFSSMLRMLPIKIFLDKVSHLQDGIDFYNKYAYDMVFIDFADDIGKKLLTAILEINPKQKIVTMSEVNSCSDFIGCDNCKQHYNKQRILKPVLENELFRVILNKEHCPMYCNEDLALDMALIAKPLSSLSFDKERFVFKKHGANQQKNISEVIQVTSKLHDKNIKYELFDGEIQIVK